MISIIREFPQIPKSNEIYDKIIADCMKYTIYNDINELIKDLKDEFMIDNESNQKNNILMIHLNTKIVLYVITNYSGHDILYAAINEYNVTFIPEELLCTYKVIGSFKQSSNNILSYILNKEQLNQILNDIKENQDKYFEYNKNVLNDENIRNVIKDLRKINNSDMIDILYRWAIKIENNNKKLLVNEFIKAAYDSACIDIPKAYLNLE